MMSPMLARSSNYQLAQTNSAAHWARQFSLVLTFAKDVSTVSTQPLSPVYKAQLQPDAFAWACFLILLPDCPDLFLTQALLLVSTTISWLRLFEWPTGSPSTLEAQYPTSFARALSSPQSMGPWWACTHSSTQVLIWWCGVTGWPAVCAQLSAFTLPNFSKWAVNDGGRSSTAGYSTSPQKHLTVVAQLNLIFNTKAKTTL